MDSDMIPSQSNMQMVLDSMQLQRQLQHSQLLEAEAEEKKEAAAAAGAAKKAQGAKKKRQPAKKRSTQGAKKRHPAKKRSVWVRDWIKKRAEFGQWEHLVKKLIEEDKSSFKQFFRMGVDLFNEILARIQHRIEKQHTWFRAPLEPGLRLAITLRFLATGNSFKSLAYSFRVPHNTISGIVHETYEAIIAEFLDEVMVMPETPEGWREVAKGFEERWNFPHCVGAIDGKHIHVRAPNPKHSGSYFFNYKGFFSIVLLAVVDSDYKFQYVDVGANGANSDAGIFLNTNLREALEEESLGLPPPEPLPGDDEPFPHYFVGDDAFSLKDWLMKPYPTRGLTREQRIFNYRLSRARMIVENVFGILVARFRVLLTTICLEPKRVQGVVLACCVIHNLIRMRRPQPPRTVDSEDPTTHEVIPGTWRNHVEQVLTDVVPLKHIRSATKYRAIRDYLMGYFNSPRGAVPWQDKSIAA